MPHLNCPCTCNHKVNDETLCDWCFNFEQNKKEEFRMRNGTPQYLPLEFETCTTISTSAAAYHLNRKPQTLLSWACNKNGPIRPKRIHGRLAWSVSEIRTLLQQGSK